MAFELHLLAQYVAVVAFQVAYKSGVTVFVILWRVRPGVGYRVPQGLLASYHTCLLSLECDSLSVSCCLLFCQASLIICLVLNFRDVFGV